MREIVLDTETTGLDPLAGHRVVELGCVELENMVATGRTFHAYFNPEMLMPAGAQDIHGLSDEFLADKPRFAEKVEEFLEFLGDAELVAEVYLELSGGRQRDLGLAPELAARAVAGLAMAANRVIRVARPHVPTAAELAAHAAFLKKLTEPLWLKA